MLNTPQRKRSTFRRASALAAATALTALLTACVTNEELGNPEGWQEILPATNPTLAALVPAELREKGTLTIGTNPPFAPNEFKASDGSIIGFEMDLIKAAASVLGLTVNIREMEFPLILPAISAGTLDVGASGFTDTLERQEHYDFVDYLNAGLIWATQPGNEHNIDPNNACGLTVAVQVGTYSDTEDVPSKSAACEAAGKPPINKMVYPSADAATTATILGRVEAYSADSPIVGFAVARSEGKLVQIGEPFDTAPYGWAVDKESPLGPALAEALQQLVADGTYEQILSPWGLQDDMVEEVHFNMQPITEARAGTGWKPAARRGGTKQRRT